MVYRGLLMCAVAVGLAGCVSQQAVEEAQGVFERAPEVRMTATQVAVPLIAGEGGRRYVEVRIHNRKCLFLVDSGAIPTLCSDSVRTTFGFRGSPMPHGLVYGGGGGVSSSLGVIDQMTIGTCQIRALPCFFVDLKDWNKKEAVAQGRAIDGILGSLFLSQVAASVDYGSNLLTLRLPSRVPVTVSQQVRSPSR